MVQIVSCLPTDILFLAFVCIRRITEIVGWDNDWILSTKWMNNLFFPLLREPEMTGASVLFRLSYGMDFRNSMQMYQRIFPFFQMICTMKIVYFIHNDGHFHQ